MTWRCSLTSNLRQGALIFVGFHNIFLFWLQALLWEGPGIFVGKNASKCQKKVQFGPPFLLEGWMTLLWGGRIFRGTTSCALFVWKMSFEIPIFCLDKLINSCQGWELFVQEFWTGLKLYSQSSTVFQKNAMKMKMLFSIQPNDLGFWCIQLMHSNFEFSDAPDPKCLGAPRALLVFWSKKFFQRLASLP